MAIGLTMQVALYNIRKRHHPKPQAFSFAQVPAAAAYSGVTITIIDRNYRLAISDGAAWHWSGTTDVIS